jgi:uncharacterized membrane protein/DNA-directed RNA polymerase subunit RPC12/RpoP
MRKGLVIIGVILLVVGILLAILGFLPFMIAQKASDVADDYDPETFTLNSYDVGDEIYVTGEVTEEAQGLGLYMYQLDDKLVVFAGEDFADKGETVTLQCQITDLSALQWPEAVEAKAIFSPLNILVIIGIVLLIVGVIVMILGIKKGKVQVAEVQAEPPQQYPVQQGYQQQQYQQPQQPAQYQQQPQKPQQYQQPTQQPQPPPQPQLTPTPQQGVKTYGCPHCQKPFSAQVPTQPMVVACPSCGGRTTIGG